MNARKVKINPKTRIEEFRPLLSKYKDYKACIRDIKLSCLFGQRVQFDIENMLPHLVIHYDNTPLRVRYLKEFRVIKMKFIINSELIVEELEVFCDTLLDSDLVIKTRESSDGSIYGFKIEKEENIELFLW